MNKKQKIMTARIVAASAMLIALAFAPFDGVSPWIRGAAYLVPYLVIGYDILRKALKGIAARQVFDENFLMMIATVGAFVLAFSREDGDFLEAVAVMLFYQIGELFQSVAVGRSRRNISALMDIRPDHANVERDGAIEVVDPDEVEVGSVIVVRPGEKVPIDGVVIEGSTTLDTSALTGESAPRSAREGAEIISGCVNMTGLIRVRTTRGFGESTVAKILDLVENASSRRSPQENFISKFARVYTPAVCAGALALAFVPPAINALFLGEAASLGSWVYRALTFLVISCPCALVVSVPLTFFAGIGGASSSGVLVKGATFLDQLSKTSCVVFDKTGTLTLGRFEVRDVVPASVSRERLIEIAALAEHASSHPIAQSIVRAYGSDPDASRVSDVREESGLGVIANVDGESVAVGSARLMERVGAKAADVYGGTVVHVAIGAEYAGHIIISDVPKPSSREAVEELRRAGVSRVVMLTGDARGAADAIASEIGITEYFSELLPADKVARAEELMASSEAPLAFVGDGINDAPVLARADVGIAMGALGSDAAIEAADVVLMDDDPRKVARAIKISRKCIRIVTQNIVFAIGVKLACLALGAFGIADMWLAIFADVGVMVLAVINAIRALFVKGL